MKSVLVAIGVVLTGFIICIPPAHSSFIIQPKNIEKAIDKADGIVQLECIDAKMDVDGNMAYRQYEFKVLDVLKNEEGGYDWKKGEKITKKIFEGFKTKVGIRKGSVQQPVLCQSKGQELILMLKRGNIIGVDYGLVSIVQTQQGKVATNKYMKKHMFKGITKGTPGAKAVKAAGVGDVGPSQMDLDTFKGIVKDFVGDGGKK
jgi:hypothetical protein